MSLSLKRFVIHVPTGEPIKETISFLAPGENGVEDTDLRLRKIEGQEGLWFFFQGENLLIDMTKIGNNNGVIPADSVYWSPYEAPTIPDIKFITEEEYNLKVEEFAVAQAAAMAQFEADQAAEVAAGQAERNNTLQELSDATGIPLEQLLASL